MRYELYFQKDIAMKNKQWILFLFLFLSFHGVKAQQTVQLSHYVFPEFRQGTVWMKNGTKNETMLNYNSLSEEMVFQDNGKMLAIGDEVLPQIDTVFIENSKFIRVKGKFMELLTDTNGSKLLAEYKCKLIPPGKPAAYGGTSHTSAAQTYSSWLSDGQVYNLQLPDDYKGMPYTVYWIDKDSDLKSFTNIGQLRKIYKDKRNEIRAYTRENKVDFKNTQDVARLIRHLEMH